MPEYLAPGVFVEEIERGPKPIEGVATSTAAFLGETERGPVWPRFITSYNEYLRLFGDVFGEGRYMPHAVKSFFDNGGRRVYVARVAGDGAAEATATFGSFTVTAIGPGSAGNRIWANLGPATIKGFRLQVAYWDRLPDGMAPFDPFADTAKLPRPFITEDFDDLSLDPNSSNYWEKRINNGDPAVNGNSSLVGLTAGLNPQAPGAVQGGALQDGDNGGAPTSAHFIGAHDDPRERTGLSALDLDPFREVALVYAPAAPEDVVKAVVTHCETNRFRFAVIDAAENVGVPASLDPRTRDPGIDSKYAAFYFPWITVSDPRSGTRINIPPCGSVLGIYARTDNTRGVFKAPANETVAGALDIKSDVNQRLQEVLNPRGVNVIRRFPGRGIRVWGARTLSSDPLWKYVNVRRLFIFIEASIYNSTQWVVFEPNDDRLWARVKQTVTLFLRTQWREGALLGLKEEEAFSVAIGRETMTEDDILNGRLIIEVGIAPVRPAEFVIFRVFQKTQEAKT